MSPEAIALLMFAAMLALMLTGQRIFAMCGAVGAVAALLIAWADGASLQFALETPFNTVFKLFSWHAMLTLPMFVYMGYMLSESGIAQELYRTMHVWFGRLPGGLAIGTIVLMVLISCINGLSVASMAIGSAIALPEMLRRGYDKVLITGVVQGGSTLGLLLPPSVVSVLYSVIARESVADMWLAGIGPGLLMAAMFIGYVYVRVRLNPGLAPALDEAELAMPLREKLTLLRAGAVPVAIFVVMLGMFLTGSASLLEASAIGATMATGACWLKGRLTLALMQRTARQTMGVTAMFMWVILGALAFSSVFDGIGAVRAIENIFLDNLDLTPWQIVFLMQVSFLILGIFLDDTAMLIIVAPLYIPLVARLDLGIENQMVWFGILYVINCQISYLSPPFGYNLFLMRSLAPPEVTIVDIYRSITPFMVMMTLTMLILMIWPDIAMWLPNALKE